MLDEIGTSQNLGWVHFVTFKLRHYPPDIFALGGRQDAGDAEILGLFREWCAAWRASSRRELSDEECEAACDVANRLAEQIYEAEVQGIVGLAIKVYMAADGSDGLASCRSDPCTFGAFTERSYSRRCVMAIRGPTLPTST